MTWDFLGKCLQLVPRFSNGRAIWCLAASPDADSLRTPSYWLKVALGHYAVMRATNALRLMPEGVSPEDRRDRVWRSFRARLAEGVRGSSLEPLIRQAAPDPQPANWCKRRVEEEVAAARRAPPGERIRRLLALM